MTTFLETVVDKFTFKVDPSCSYTEQGIWVRVEGNNAKIGLSDFLQQRSGDIAFVDVKPQGTLLVGKDEFGSIETIKVTVTLNSPVTGQIVAINPALESTPEVINQDPYGDGWLCEIELSQWESDRQNLLNAQAYFEFMKHEAEEEVKGK